MQLSFGVRQQEAARFIGECRKNNHRNNPADTGIYAWRNVMVVNAKRLLWSLRIQPIASFGSYWYRRDLPTARVGRAFS